MKTPSSKSFRFSRLAVLSLALAFISAGAFAQKQASQTPAAPKGYLVFGISEGAAGNMSAADIAFRYEEFEPIVEKALGVPVTLIGVRDQKAFRRSLETGAFDLAMSRPADVLAEAVRDHGYQVVAVSKEVAHALFIVNKDSPLKTIADVKGKSILTPDRNAYMWRIANAMLRDNKIIMEKEKVRSMSDQGAIGYSMEGGYFDVGVVASFSGVGRNWEKNGGRVIARSPELPNTPMIASPKISAAQLQRLRAALLAMDTTESGSAVLKRIAVTGFKEASSQSFIDLTKWLEGTHTPKN